MTVFYPWNEIQYLGCSWSEKVEAVRSKMVNEKASICVFTKLDEIACK